jgi:hypothetical protein
MQEASARDESVRVGRPVHGVGEADARGERVGAGRPVHGSPSTEQGFSAKNASVGVGRPVHEVREANARSVNLDADRPVHGVPVHGAQEDYAEGGSVEEDYPPTEGSESSDAVWRRSPERDEGSGAFSTPAYPKGATHRLILLSRLRLSMP